MKYKAKAESNLASDDFYPIEDREIMIYDHTAEKMSPEEDNGWEACDAYHGVHYHADAKLINDKGEEEGDFITVCVECCAEIK